MPTSARASNAVEVSSTSGGRPRPPPAPSSPRASCRPRARPSSTDCGAVRGTPASTSVDRIHDRSKTVSGAARGTPPSSRWTDSRYPTAGWCPSRTASSPSQAAVAAGEQPTIRPSTGSTKAAPRAGSPKSSRECSSFSGSAWPWARASRMESSRSARVPSGTGSGFRPSRARWSLMSETNAGTMTSTATVSGRVVISLSLRDNASTPRSAAEATADWAVGRHLSVSSASVALRVETRS